MSTRKYAIAIAVLVAASTARAQQALLGAGAAYLSSGSSSVETSDLDARLRAGGYPTFGEKALNAGIGGYRLFTNRWMLGAEITGLAFKETAQNGREYGLGGGYATLGVGYARQLSPRVRIYPRVGLGAGGITLWVQEADTATFDFILANPQPVPARERLLSRDGGVIDLGGGLEFLSRRDHGWLLGLRAGVILSSFGDDTNWWTQNGAATNGPPASITGAYLRFILGGAWNR